MYFRGFSEAANATDEASGDRLGVDPAADKLPFDLLDDRRFEVLAYRLKRAKLGSAARVTLMQGVGERGRDVVVYSAEGNLLEIIQCKRLQDRMTAPALRAELLKLALHAYLEPAIIGTALVSYELWCPGGFTEPATDLMNTWPQSWTADSLVEPATEVLENTARLSTVSWKDARAFVIDEFPRRVSPTPMGNVDISLLVRGCPAVYRQYFEAKLVMDPRDVRNALQEWISDLPAPGCDAAIDAAGIARRVEDIIGVTVEIALSDAGTLHLWVRGSEVSRETIRQELLPVACVASDAPGVEEIVVGLIDSAAFVGTVGGRGIGTVRVGFPAAATRRVASLGRASSEFWECVSVYLMDPPTENTPMMRFARLPFRTFDRGGTL